MSYGVANLGEKLFSMIMRDLVLFHQKIVDKAAQTYRFFEVLVRRKIALQNYRFNLFEQSDFF